MRKLIFLVALVSAIALCVPNVLLANDVCNPDTTPPDAPAPPADVNLQCTADVPPPVDLTATDNCDGDITVSPTAVITPGNCNNQFVMVRTWTFTDNSGNQSSVSQTIIVDDTTPPDAPAPPADVNLQCTADVPPPVNLTATDNCGGDITVSPTAVITPGNCNNNFTMVRTWTFTDDCGNSSSVSQTINVDDTTPPSAPPPPADVNLQCAQDVPPPVDLTATDNCDGDSTVSPTAQVIPGSCANEFEMVRTWTAFDSCGNVSSVSQTVSVEDNTAPVITCPPDGTSESATATDSCDSDVTPTFSDSPDHVRTWTATDDCGNTSSCDQLLCVEIDPKTAGYWHRQCLGVSAGDGGIDPGRKGKGPKAPTEPDFEDGLMECADLTLEDLGFFEDTTCSGLDPDPPSDDCERALKQLTALILNLCSDRLQIGCPVCLDRCGIDGSADNVADLIDEIAEDILLDDGYCKEAAEKVALVNEGEGLCFLDD